MAGWLVRKLLAACGNPAVRFVLWDGSAISPSSDMPVGNVVIRDPQTLRQLVLAPVVTFGDAYCDGRIELEGDLVEILSAACRAVARVRPTSWFGRILERRRARRQPRSTAESRDSVYHHYDIGNEFYKLWLDERLLYTCAYYANPTDTLEQAQVAKMHHVCRKVWLRPGDAVVEAGCGWGGLALHMARHYGVSVRAFNLSHEQIVHAREWAKSEGLAGQVEFVEDDYRNVSGKYDAFVSVGMLEHVGPENYRDLGRLIDRSLTLSGRGLIHTIGRNAPRPLDPWIEKRIFPKAYPPALSELTEIFEPCNLSILDVENLRLHYVRTLEHWLQRYDRAASKIASMFDERFVRMWRLYLAGSIATFRVGSLQLFQMLFSRESNNDIPWTREHLYHPVSPTEG